MRSDFLGDCAQFVGFAELVNDTQYLLPRLSETQMMRAICQPPAISVAMSSRNWPCAMIAESRRLADALPLIQHCLMYMWTEGQNRPRPDDGGPHPLLRLEDYHGLNKTLSSRAEAAFARLTGTNADDVVIAEHLFRAIIAIDAQGRAVRRPMRRSTLLKITGGDEAGFERVLAAFADPDTGFIFASRDEDPIIDITHEALIRCWDRLNDTAITIVSKGRPAGWLLREQEDERIWRALLVQAENNEIINPERWPSAKPGLPACRVRPGPNGLAVVGIRSRLC